MKRLRNTSILFFVLFAALQCGLQAQSNLQFSRVILLNKNVLDSVPASKVWKIETWTYEAEICGGWSATPLIVQFNGTNHYIRANVRDGNGSYYGNAGPGALWIPAGTTVRALDAGGCLQALSIIEFTITP
jgi:hypothetical protein